MRHAPFPGYARRRGFLLTRAPILTPSRDDRAEGAHLIVSHAADSSPGPAERRVLVLVVERNPIVQRLEKFFLEQAGYAVEFAADGLSALARARALHPVIVVSE